MNNEADNFVHKRMDSAFVVINVLSIFPEEVSYQSTEVVGIQCSLHRFTLLFYRHYSHECCSSSVFLKMYKV